MINRFFLLLMVVFMSCVSRKGMVYFQPKDKNPDVENVQIKGSYISKIQPGDILSIGVFSLSPEANQMFNVFPEGQMMQSQNQNNSSTELTAPVGFLVDRDGSITLPLAGKITLMGMNTKDASDTITKRLGKYLLQPTVNVRILNFKISILGEVTKPSVYTISNERVTIPEALSLAGDLTIYGKRRNVLLIREENGVREFKRINLTQRNFFDSSYYYLRPNDIVYVEPSRGKVISSGTAIVILPTIISSLSLLLLGYYYYHVTK